jgi:hypothetical protein
MPHTTNFELLFCLFCYTIPYSQTPPGAEGDPSAKRALAAAPHHRKPNKTIRHFASAKRAAHRKHRREPKATQARSAHSQRRRITENQTKRFGILQVQSARHIANTAGEPKVIAPLNPVYLILQ